MYSSKQPYINNSTQFLMYLTWTKCYFVSSFICFSWWAWHCAN